MTDKTNSLIDGVSGQTLRNVRNVLCMIQSVDLSDGGESEVEMGIFRTLDLCIGALNHEIAKGEPA